MATFKNPKRIRKEEFSEEFQEMVGQLGFIINDVFSDLEIAFNEQIDRSNFVDVIKTINVTVDDTGAPLQQTIFETTFNRSLVGLHVIRSQNLSNVANIPIAAVQIVDFSETIIGAKKIVTVKNIKGLVVNEPFTLVLNVVME